MNTDKKYVTSSLAAQMILIPILLTGGLYIVSILTNGISVSELGKDTWKFIELGIALVGSLAVGTLVGVIFSKGVKNKPESAKSRYLPLLIPILYALVFALLALVMSKGNYNSQWWGFYMLKNPFFLIFDFVLAFSGLTFLLPVAELFGYAGFALGIFLDELRTKTTLNNSAARTFKKGFALVCIAVIVFSGMLTRDVILYGMIELVNGKTTMGEELTEYNLSALDPFIKNNGLAKLDHPASLQFTDMASMPRLDGATAAYPVYAAFVEAVYKGLGDYYAGNRDQKDEKAVYAEAAGEASPMDLVRCSKTGEAYERLINGQTDIIFVAEPSKEHVAAVRAKGKEFVLTPIGSEAFVFFTNVKNPVNNLSIKQIQGIYAGEITNWKEVGGPFRGILAFQRPENSGSQTIMQNRVMKDIKMMEPTQETRASGMGEIISRVAGYRNAQNAIGYSFMYYSSQMIQNNQIKYLSINGIKPETETIRSKTYPFTIPVYAVTLKSNKNENVGKLLKWITSEEGQTLVERTGYVRNGK